MMLGSRSHVDPDQFRQRHAHIERFGTTGVIAAHGCQTVLMAQRRRRQFSIVFPISQHSEDGRALTVIPRMTARMQAAALERSQQEG